MKSPTTPSSFPFSHPFLALFVVAIGTLVLSGNAVAVPPTSYSTNFDSMNTGSIFGQEGWVNLNSNPNYPYNENVTSFNSHSPSQSWQVSNSTNDGTVRAIGTPIIAQV